MNKQEFDQAVKAKIKANSEQHAVTMRSNNNELREQLAADVEAFIAKGGKVQELDYCQSAITDDNFKVRLY